MPRKKLCKNLENKILSVAEKLFLEKGYNKTGIRDIAKECGISIGLIYKIFESKEDIFIRILKKHIKIALKEINEALSQATSFEDKLNKFLENFIKQFRKKEKFFYIFLTSLGTNFLIDKKRFQLQDIAQKISQIFQNILEEGKQKGFIDKNIDTFFLSKYILGGIINNIYGYVIEKNEKLPENFLDMTKNIIKKFLNKK